MREHLSQAGFQVAVSRYEADGLKRLAEWVPDLVLVSTAHPAGDFVEYCRRVRALAPAARIVVTSSLNRERLFQEHPGLQAIVDGVLLRPTATKRLPRCSAPGPAAAGARPEPGRRPGNAELRAEFQRQLDARFLEVEELKRHLEVATRRAAAVPGLEWLQSENEHLRQGVEEARKKAALALATEQLKRSEIEVKLDNLLRMKEDFEFRAQNELEDRTQEIERLRGQLQEVRERSDKASRGARGDARRDGARAGRKGAARGAAPRAGGRRRRGGRASGGARRTHSALRRSRPRLSRQRALAAEGQVALADAAAKAAVLEESLVARAAAGGAGPASRAGSVAARAGG